MCTCSEGAASPTFDIMQTMKPFSSILYDSTVFASCKILPIQGVHDQHNRKSTLTKSKKFCLPLSMHTRIDELLQASLPSFLARYLLFHLPNLCPISVISFHPLTVTRHYCPAIDRTVSEESASITNFCCFRSCYTSQTSMHG